VDAEYGRGAGPGQQDEGAARRDDRPGEEVAADRIPVRVRHVEEGQS
jgi:hypothetical protein